VGGICQKLIKWFDENRYVIAVALEGNRRDCNTMEKQRGEG
jgi:hypothetical protein